MAEEQQQHRYEAAQEGHRLCANNCGLFGSPATLNLCSKCYGDFRLNPTSLSFPPSASSVAAAVTTSPQRVVSSPATKPDDDVAVVAQPNGCWVCRKRVGLMGFKCRCGTTFCGVHRYPEKHGCEFDFKKFGREEIARANPVVKAAKLDRI